MAASENQLDPKAAVNDRGPGPAAGRTGLPTGRSPGEAGGRALSPAAPVLSVEDAGLDEHADLLVIFWSRTSPTGPKYRFTIRPVAPHRLFPAT